MMKLKEAMNLYKLHSNPSELAGYGQAKQKILAAHPGKCAVLDTDPLTVKMHEGGVVECIIKALSSQALTDIEDDLKDGVVTIGPFSEERLDEALGLSDIGYDDDMDARVHALAGKLRSINPSTIITERDEDYLVVSALTQPVNVVMEALSKAGELSDW